jgi:hypothetical protein
MSIRKNIIHLCLMTFLLSVGSAHAVDLSNMTIKQLNARISNNPLDEDAWFMKALAYHNRGEADKAISTYNTVIDLFPNQIEAYINLANLYIQKKQYEDAKATLVKSFSQNELYQEAYSGLQNINQYLAAKAYQQALNQNVAINEPSLKKYTALETKTDSLSNQPTLALNNSVNQVAQNQPAQITTQPTQPAQVIQAEPQQQATELIESQEKVEETKTVEAETVEVETVPELSNKVSSWAAAWSAQNVIEFVGHYAPDYRVSGKTRQQWLADRREKLTNKSFIRVKVSDFEQTEQANGQIRVQFRQNYRSNTIADTVTKRLTFQQFNGDWKIVGERIVR